MVYPGVPLTQNHMRLRISPDVAIAMATMVLAHGEEGAVQSAEMLASHHPSGAEMDAYERVLGDALEGDATLFARQDYVEEAWRIVDPVLKKATAVHVYEPGTWGPAEVDTRVSPPGGWLAPVVGPQEDVFP
jgi:glucose-6-phosphate 1-dehydrogenase